MNAKPLTVIAQIKAKPGKESRVRQELLSLVAPSRKDAGCLNYDLHQALDNPDPLPLPRELGQQSAPRSAFPKGGSAGRAGRVSQLVAEPPQITLWEKIG